MLIDAADVFDHPLGTPQHTVTGAVHARPRRTERVRHKTLGAHGRASVIFPGQTRAAQVQLATDPDRHRLQACVENVGTTVADRTADGRVGRQAGLAGRHLPHQRRDHGFGRAVAIDQGARRQGLADPLEIGLGHGFAAEGVQVQRRGMPPGPGFGGQLGQIHRREAGVGDLLLLQGLQGARRGPQLFVAQHQAGTAGQRGQPALMGTVEGEGDEVKLAGLGTHVVQRRGGIAMHGQRAMGHGHAFGRAAGAGGVDQVRKILRMHLDAGGLVAVVVQVQPVEVEHGQTRGLRQAIQGHLFGEQQAHAAVGLDEAQTFARIIQGQGHKGRTGLGHRQQRHQQAVGTLQGDADPNFGPDTASDQGVGQTVGLPLQLATAQVLPLANQRNTLRVGRGVGGDSLLHTAEGRGRVVRAAPGHELSLFSSAQRAKRCQRLQRIGTQAKQQLLQMSGQGLDPLRGESITTVAEADVQGLTGEDRQGQWIVGGFKGAGSFDAHPAALAHGVIHRVVLEHQQAVEQALPAQARPTLDVGQRGVLELAGIGAAGLQLAQPVAHRLCRSTASDHRHGIDEQADHRFGIIQGCRTTRYRGAEHHPGLAGIGLQQQGPRALHQGVEGDPLTPGKLAQPLAVSHRQAAANHPVARGFVKALGVPGRQALGQQGRAIQGCQTPLPVGLGSLPILGTEPGDVIAVLATRRPRPFTGVMLQHFADQSRAAPAVQQDVVEGPDHAAASGIQT